VLYLKRGDEGEENRSSRGGQIPLLLAGGLFMRSSVTKVWDCSWFEGRCFLLGW